MANGEKVREVQVRLEIVEPEQITTTTTWLEVKSCPPEGAEIKFRDRFWTVKHRWATREVDA